MLQIDGGDKRNFGEFRWKHISASENKKTRQEESDRVLKKNILPALRISVCGHGRNKIRHPVRAGIRRVLRGRSFQYGYLGRTFRKGA